MSDLVKRFVTVAPLIPLLILAVTWSEPWAFWGVLTLCTIIGSGEFARIAKLSGTERGLTASSTARAEINELIAALESHNPTTSPTEALAAMAGTWTLT